MQVVKSDTETHVNLDGIHRGEKQFFESTQADYDKLLQSLRNAQNSIIKKVLSDLLQREATPEDAKHLSMVYYHDPNKQYLFYHGVEIGTIDHIFENYNYKCVFNPK